MPDEAEVDILARNLYDSRKPVGPPIGDSGWEFVKQNTPNYYNILCNVARGLIENE